MVTSVQYIPNLGQNLISIYIFDIKGYNYSSGGRGGRLKVIKDSLIIIKGHLKDTKLYILEDSSLPAYWMLRILYFSICALAI